jgi:hypothetical protein
MCLLITAPAGATLDEEVLKDFTVRNNDGYGFMYVEDGVLKTLKRVGQPEKFVEDWNSLIDFERAIHLRMKTHGNIDEENCHPYIVYEADDKGPGIALMHNGILRTGNQTDTTKSDTWHFVHTFLKPILAIDRDLINVKAFQAMLKDFIGYSNKFVLLDSEGNMVVVGRESGLEWKDMWFSNQYAWSPEKFGAVEKPKYYGGYQNNYQGASKSWEGTKNSSDTFCRGRDRYDSVYDGDDPVGAEDVPETVEATAPAGAPKEVARGQTSVLYLPKPAKLVTPDDGLIFVDEGIERAHQVAEIIDALDFAGLMSAGGTPFEVMDAYAKKFSTETLWEMTTALFDGELDERLYKTFLYQSRKFSLDQLLSHKHV